MCSREPSFSVRPSQSSAMGVWAASSPATSRRSTAGCWQCDPYVHARLLEPGVEAVPLDEALPAADIVTLHVNLTHETRQFFGVRQFDAMKPGSYFINTSRGELVDETAFLAALRPDTSPAPHSTCCVRNIPHGMGRIPSYSTRETIRISLITPHIGGCTVESMQKTELFLCEKLMSYMAARLHKEVIKRRQLSTPGVPHTSNFMRNTAIRVEGLSKLYTIGETQQPYRTLRDTVTDAFSKPFRAFRRKSAAEERKRPASGL